MFECDSVDLIIKNKWWLSWIENNHWSTLVKVEFLKAIIKIITDKK